MNVDKRAKIIVDWINDYCDNTSFKPNSLIVEVPGSPFRGQIRYRMASDCHGVA